MCGECACPPRSPPHPPQVIPQLPAYLQRHAHEAASAGTAGLPTDVDLDTVMWTDPVRRQLALSKLAPIAGVDCMQC